MIDVAPETIDSFRRGQAPVANANFQLKKRKRCSNRNGLNNACVLHFQLSIINFQLKKRWSGNWNGRKKY
jgi:hypothetical protein